MALTRIEAGDYGWCVRCGEAIAPKRVGRWIDRTTVARYTIGVAALLAGACALMAVGRSLPLLVGTLYLPRLGGPGLMVHTSLTAIARAFPGQRGKALGIPNLGMPVAEAVLPLSVALGMAAIGWRAVWAGGVAVILVWAPCSRSPACRAKPASCRWHRSRRAAIRSGRADGICGATRACCSRCPRSWRPPSSRRGSSSIRRGCCRKRAGRSTGGQAASSVTPSCALCRWSRSGR